MDATRMTLLELFERGRQYCVPLFQRPYVWSERRQWEPLWLDILDQAEGALKNDNSNRVDCDEQPHFLGAIVSQKRDTFGREIFKADIVDGQQRLVTFQIIFSAFKDIVQTYIDEIHDAAVVGDLENIIRDFCRLTRNEGTMDADHEKYKVWPARANQGAFELAMNRLNIRDVEEFTGEPDKDSSLLAQDMLLVNAYNYFYKSIEGFCFGEDNTWGSDVNDRIESLSYALKYLFVVVHIELKNHEDPQVIFESLNARGESLLPSDLICNYIFMRAAAKGNNIQDLYDRLWREYDERREIIQGKESSLFWKKTDSYARTRVKRIDAFLFHYLQSQIPDREISANHLYWTFREWWKRSDCDENIEGQLSKIMNYSKMFELLVAPTDKDAVGRLAYRLKILETTTVYPLLLHLLARRNSDIKQDDLNGILCDLESYLVRRYVCGLSPKNYNKFFRSLLGYLSEREFVDRSIVQKYLLDGEGNTSIWPTDEKFKKEWLARPVFNKHNSRRIGMILSVINDSMYSERSEIVSVKKLTVEHILPQKWDEESWPIVSNVQYMSQEEKQPEETRNRLLNTFGNLTLLSRKLNSSINNAPFVQKKPEIDKDSHIAMNKFIRNKEEWSETSIFERGESLFNHAKKIWPRPETELDLNS